MVTKRRLKSVDVLYSSEDQLGRGARLCREAQARVEGQVSPFSQCEKKMAASDGGLRPFQFGGEWIPPDVES